MRETLPTAGMKLESLLSYVAIIYGMNKTADFMHSKGAEPPPIIMQPPQDEPVLVEKPKAAEKDDYQKRWEKAQRDFNEGKLSERQLRRLFPKEFE
jgi:hypothetical protein